MIKKGKKGKVVPKTTKNDHLKILNTPSFFKKSHSSVHLKPNRLMVLNGIQYLPPKMRMYIYELPYGMRMTIATC